MIDPFDNFSHDLEELTREVSRLLEKVQTSERTVHRAEAFYLIHRDEWREEIAASFMDILERKKDQIHYEWDRIGRLGDAISRHLGREWNSDLE